MIVDRGDAARPNVLPQITDEFLAECDERQKVWARQHPTEGNRARHNASLRIKELEELNVLTARQREQLAEAYALTGQFKLASDTTADTNKKKVWNGYWKAVYADDAKWCKCKPKDHLDQHGRITQKTQRRTIGTIFSHRDNKEVSLDICDACGRLNTRTN